VNGWSTESADGADTSGSDSFFEFKSAELAEGNDRLKAVRGRRAKSASAFELKIRNLRRIFDRN